MGAGIQFWLTQDVGLLIILLIPMSVVIMIGMRAIMSAVKVFVIELIRCINQKNK